MMATHRRELSVAAAIGLTSLVLALVSPRFFSPENLGDLLLGNLPVLLVAIGATLIILTGEIDISVGSMFAICGVVAGVAAHAGLSTPAIVLVACLCGAALGAINGALVAFVGLPSIVVTLATMVAWRDASALGRPRARGFRICRRPSSGSGYRKRSYPLVACGIALVLQLAFSWALSHVAAGRADLRDRIRSARRPSRRHSIPGS